ncbi:MAG: cation-transporting P-type ATPase [Planctomycetota bacterium]|nr:cation-transporting P-type ATPase [Planctomycetota bacterium]
MRHEVPLERIRELGSRGLTSGEVLERRSRFGSNDILEAPRHTWLDLALETAKDPMLGFLVGTSILYAFLGETTEALVLLASVVPLAGMDAFLHRRAQASTEGLQKLLATHARVERDGVVVEVPSAELVPGDLALVKTGEPFPADGLVVESRACQVDESALTGESFPVHKRVAELHNADGPLQLEGEQWGFAGTRVLAGEARVRIAWVGEETLYGGIVRSALSGTTERTPLQVAVNGLVRALVAFAVVLCGLLAFTRWRQGYGVLDALVSALTLAVAALPEEFPVVLSVFLGVGALRLSQRGALVRRAVTVENIGRVTTICSDKTGTLTEGKLELTHVVALGTATEREVRECALRASLEGGDDPLDRAVIAGSTGLERGRQLARFPFTEDRKRETAVAVIDGRVVAASKGAPEAIARLCACTDEERARLERETLTLAEGGHKVIACAARELGREGDGAWAGGEPDRGYRLLGVIAFEDPLRAGVREALAECADAGIRTIMVTGDHPSTAKAIATDAGLGGGEPRVISGEDLDRIVREAPGELERVDVIARAIPSQKLALVKALQHSGHVVAVTGDGVNDVPALQAADVGIAMGARGTRSAREVASIVLAQDDFGEIVHAIREGRQLFRNLQLGFQYLLLIHMPLVLTAAMLPLSGHEIAYLPVHVVGLELMIHPTALFVFQELAPAVKLQKAAKRASGTFFARADWAVIVLSSLLLTLGILAGFELAHEGPGGTAAARAMALATLALANIAVTFALTGLRRRSALLVSGVVLVAAILPIEVPALAELLQLHSIGLLGWLGALGVALVGALPVALRARAVGRANRQS